jgi:predicted Zn-dependent peptidase
VILPRLIKLGTTALVLAISCSQSQDIEDRFANVTRIHTSGVPICYIQAIVNSGSANDPAGLEGLAWFSANLMLNSSEVGGSGSTDNRLSEPGTELTVTVGRNSIAFTCKSLASRANESIQLLKKVLLQPTFRENEVTKVIAMQQDSIRSSIDNDYVAESSLFLQSLYTDNKANHPVLGYISNLAKFDTAKADSFFLANFTSSNIAFGIAGDFTDENVISLQVIIDSLPTGFAQAVPETTTPIMGKNVVLVESDSSNRSSFMLGTYLRLEQNDTDFAPLLVAEAYLELAYDRLMDKDISSPCRCWKDQNRKIEPTNRSDMSEYFGVHAACAPEDLEFAVKLSLYELSILRADPVDVSEFEMAKGKARNSVQLYNATMNDRLTDAILSRTRSDHIGSTELSSRIDGVSIEDVKTALARYVSDEDILIVALVPNATAARFSLLDNRTAAGFEGPSGMLRSDIHKEILTYDLELREENITLLELSSVFK